MPIVSGNVFFDSAANNTGTAGIANVPVVLQNTTTNVGLVVLTNASGAFTFNNVPNGSYRLVESWGFSGGVATPGNFASATTIAVPVGDDPPASAVSGLPAGTNRIYSVTPNTQFITVSGSDITGRIFRDGPQIERPIVVSDISYVGSNIITAADNGTWGSNTAGTAVNTSPATAPYPGVVPGFTYFSGVPSDGSYTIMNISSAWTGAFVGDHTTGDETGRMQLVNGANPGSLFFTQTVNVKANTFYQFSTWMLNMTAGALPALGYEIRTTGGVLLFSADASGLNFTTPRTWQELGTFFNTGSNTQLVVNLVSRGPAAGGNDFAIDDVALTEATINDILTTTKRTSKSYANVGDVIDYTIILRNTGNSTITNMNFVDTIANGTTFNTGTVQINGTTLPANNPSFFTFASPFVPMAPGATVTVTYKVTVNTIPSPNPIPNQSTVNYAFAPINGGTTVAKASATNIVSTTVNNGDINTRKLVNRTYAAIGDIVTYTIPITNRGNTTTNNIVMIDTIPSGTSFITDSLTIDNLVQTGLNPSPPGGASIGNLGPGATKTIAFSVTVTTIPSPNPFVNSATFNYSFLVDPVTITNKTSGANTNTVSTRVFSPILSQTKTVDKAFANVGDTLTYTVVLKNTGNATLNNTLMTDTIPTDTSFSPSSVIINNVPNATTVPLANALRISVGNVAPNGTATLVFKVNVNTIPNPNPIPNLAFTSYTYTLDPSIPNGRTGSINSNTVTTQVNNANLGNIVKGVDKQYAKINDELTYTITIPNSGNTTATNVIFKDTIPSGTSFIPNSVMINGIIQNGFVVEPPTGLSLGSIAPNTALTISFKVTVNTIPSPNPIPNSGNVTYGYIIDPILGTTATETNNTNIVNTTINSAVINSTKSVTPTNTTVGETLFYTIILTNSGNATAINVTFIDTIPNDTTFVPNSLVVDSTTISGSSPNPPGIGISNILPGGRTTITFRVTVDTIPAQNPIINSSSTNYNFVVNSATGETAPNTSLSNIVETFISPDSNPLKIVDTDYAKPGEILTYTVRWQNRLNVTTTNVTFIDTIPNDTSFIADSVVLNGVTIPGATVAPPNGINIGTIPSGVYTTISFKVKVNTIPNPNPIPNQAYGRYSYVSDTILGTVTTETGVSNIVYTQINYASIPSAIKQVNRAFAKVGDILTYTISFTNIGNTTAINIKLIDTIPNDTSFNINSVYVNGTNRPGEVVAPPTGLSVGDLGVNDRVTITFNVTVNTIPNPNPIPNTANIGYDYTVDPIVNRTSSDATNTNTVNTKINYATLGLASKTVDKAYANVGDIITYTITYVNTGNVTANNVIVVDTIPIDTSFVTQSVVINNSPNTTTTPTGNILNINLGNIVPNATGTLLFKVKVDTIPSVNPILNEASSSFNYTVDPSIPNGEISNASTNIVSTQVNNANLNGTMKFVDKVFAICGDELSYTISIPNSGNITAINVIINDTVPNGTTFVPNSMRVNGLQVSSNPISIPIGSIGPGATATISYRVKITCS